MQNNKKLASDYEGYRAWATAVGMADVYGSAEAFLAAKRAQADAMPSVRVVRVTATTLGREFLERLGKLAEVHHHAISDWQTRHG